jgi:hypothetical protein
MDTKVHWEKVYAAKARKHGNPAPATLRLRAAILVLPLSGLLKKAARATE